MRLNGLLGDEQRLRHLAVREALGGELGHTLPSQISFWVYTTGENEAYGSNTPGLGNMPSIQFEIDPNVAAVNSNYASLIYVPGNTAPNAWTHIDAVAENGSHWAFTRDLDPVRDGNQAHCFTAGSYCTFAEAMAAFVGLQPKFTQDPPRSLRSASATVRPSPASL